MPSVHAHHKVVETEMLEEVGVISSRSSEIGVSLNCEEQAFGQVPQHGVVYRHELRARPEGGGLER